MIFKYFKKYFDKIYLTEEADTISKKNKTIKGYKVNINLKVNSNKRKIFYIIQRSPGAGMFSNLIFVLNHLKICSMGHNITFKVSRKFA